MNGHTDDVTDVAFSPESEVATASRDGTVKIWNVSAAGYEEPLIGTLDGHDDRVLSVAFNPDGSLLASGGTDKTAIVWELGWDETGSIREGVVKERFYDHTDTIADVAFSPNGRCLVTASLDRTARLWDVADGRQLMKLGGHRDGVISAAFRPGAMDFETAMAEPCGSELATTGWDGEAYLWNTGPTAEVATFAGHLGPVESVDYSPNGSRIVSGSDDGTARVWSVTTGEMLLNLAGEHEGRVNRVAYSPDGLYIATASWDGAACLWDAETGELLQRYGTAPEIGALRGAGHMRLRRQEAQPPVEASGVGRDTQAIGAFRVEGRALQGLAFSPNGSALATAGDSGQVESWSVPADDEPDTPFSAVERLYSVRFNEMGTVQITTAEDGRLYAWETAAPDGWRPYQYLREVIDDAAFSPDGSQLG